MVCAQKKQKDIRFEKEAKALKNNLEKRRKMLNPMKNRNMRNRNIKRTFKKSFDRPSRTITIKVKG